MGRDCFVHEDDGNAVELDNGGSSKPGECTKNPTELYTLKWCIL